MKRIRIFSSKNMEQPAGSITQVAAGSTTQAAVGSTTQAAAGSTTQAASGPASVGQASQQDAEEIICKTLSRTRDKYGMEGR
ncbi:hypothetical protein Tco_0791238 [Tanacetum coccineum]